MQKKENVISLLNKDLEEKQEIATGRKKFAVSSSPNLAG
jgi:hypothetical protein